MFVPMLNRCHPIKSFFFCSEHTLAEIKQDEVSGKLNKKRKSVPNSGSLSKLVKSGRSSSIMEDPKKAVRGKFLLTELYIP